MASREKKNGKLILRFKESHTPRIISDWLEITRLSKTKKSISSKLVERFINSFEPEGLLLFNQNRASVSKIKDKMLIYFSKREEYKFEFSEIGFPSNDTKPYHAIHTLSTCLDYVISSLALSVDYKTITTNKRKLIQFIYVKFYEYFFAHLAKEARIPISDYTIVVMTGYISREFGFGETKKKGKDTFKYFTSSLYDIAEYFAKNSKSSPAIDLESRSVKSSTEK